jgi:hypothetical protein
MLVRRILKTAYGDLDLNRQVSPSDLARLISNYRGPGQFGWADGNINGSQQPGTFDNPRITPSDLAIMIANYRFGLSASAAAIGAVPETRTSILAFGALFVGLFPRYLVTRPYAGFATET